MRTESAAAGTGGAGHVGPAHGTDDGPAACGDEGDRDEVQTSYRCADKAAKTVILDELYAG
jgi:hypothetical protein